MKLYAVIMAGGSGTRFWPLSRARRPKQFLPLASASPLLADTVRRLSGLVPAANTFVVCGPQHARWVRKVLPKLPAAQVVVEPVPRNTAPAIGLAAVHVARKDPNGMMLVLPSDHAIRDSRAFRECVRKAASIAEQGYLVAIGIRPNRPETGFGYIQVGEPLAGGSHRVKAFVEKPDAHSAERYLASGDFLWNAGMFVFRTDAIASAFQKLMPELSAALSTISAGKSRRSLGREAVRAFKHLPTVSIDYGVMEKADNLAVLPAEFGWSDLGSFASIAEVRRADERGNVVSGKAATLIDCEDCVVFAADRALALVGLSRMVVVDGGDVVLVVPREKGQDVRKAVEAFKARGLSRFL